MHYKIKAYRAPEGVIFLRFIAANPMDARQQAESKGYRVISIRKQGEFAARLTSRQRFSVALFSQELLALLEAGLGLVEAIEVLFHKSSRAENKKVLGTIAQYLREGKSFSYALGEMPNAFPPLYVATARTSEQTGDLIEALQRYLAYHQQINFVRNKIITASIYPMLLIAVGLLVIVFLLGYVVPRFSQIYEDLGNNLPWTSRLLMHWGHFFDAHAWWIIASGCVLALGVSYSVTRQSTRSAFSQTLWSIPGLGERVRVYQLARLNRTLAMLINGGIPFVNALNMSTGLLRQPALKKGVSNAVQAICEGKSVSDAFSVNGLGTEVGIRLLAVGERSGNLGHTMERIAKLYDDESVRWIDWFTRLFEPILMIAIGLIIGLIVLLMYLPIFELASSIQ